MSNQTASHSVAFRAIDESFVPVTFDDMSKAVEKVTGLTRDAQSARILEGPNGTKQVLMKIDGTEGEMRRIMGAFKKSGVLPLVTQDYVESSASDAPEDKRVRRFSDFL